MAGEIGELAEIFQWKGSLDNIPFEGAGFTARERVHIGEEIADVFVYCTRLCDECNVNVTAVIRRLLAVASDGPIDVSDCHGVSGAGPGPFLGSTPSASRTDGNAAWDPLTFAEVRSLIGDSAGRGYIGRSGGSVSPRAVIYQLLRHLGTVGAALEGKGEARQTPEMATSAVFNVPGEFFVEWTDVAEIRGFVIALAEIYLCLMVLCEYIGLEQGAILEDKIGKNNRKYPADLVRGRSAKYTAYEAEVAARSQEQQK